jgi:hypothetical protein
MRPEKLSDLMAAIKTCIEEGHYLDTRHAFQRQEEREITRPELLYVEFAPGSVGIRQRARV